MNYAATSDPTIPRGIRDNNPGNIKTGDNWQGMTGVDGPFIVFADTTWGLRAIARALTTMIGKGYNTIETLIPQWSATDQQAYVNNVSAGTGIPPNDPLTPDPTTLHDLIREIVNQENGQSASLNYVSDQDIDQGIAMASSSLATIPQAAIIYATANPAQALMILLTIGVTAYYLFGDNERPAYIE